MKHTFFLAPAGAGVGLTTVSLGLVNALDRRGVRVAFFKPISQLTESASGLERSTHFIRSTTALQPAEPIPVAKATKMISEERLDELLGQVVAAFHDSTAAADVVVIEGLRSARGDSHLGTLNQELVKTLNARVILVASSADKAPNQLDDQVEYSAKMFGGLQKLLGVVVNHYPISEGVSLPRPADRFRSESQLFRRGKVQLIGVVPHNESLTYPRTLDIQRHLGAEVFHAGDMEHRRVKQRFLMGRRVPNSFHTLVPGAILVTATDRDDIIIAAAMAALSKVPLAGLILTGDMPIDERVVEFCRPALDTGLPLLRVRTGSYEAATQLFQLSTAVPADDLERTQAAVDHVAQSLDL
jgi:phosphate acetyltransferase